MSYPYIKEMDDSIKSKSKSLCSINIWTSDINNEIKNPCLIILVMNIIIIEHYDL
jgi:hypothetical protein